MGGDVEGFGGKRSHSAFSGIRFFPDEAFLIPHTYVLTVTFRRRLPWFYRIDDTVCSTHTVPYKYESPANVDCGRVRSTHPPRAICVWRWWKHASRIAVCESSCAAYFFLSCFCHRPSTIDGTVHPAPRCGVNHVAVTPIRNLGWWCVQRPRLCVKSSSPVNNAWQQYG